MEEVKFELSQGRRCQIFAVFTLKHDVTQRLKALLAREGIRVEVLTSDVPPERREAWYEQKLQAGMQVCIAHPKLVMTGLDYVEYGGCRGLFFLKQVVRFPRRVRLRPSLAFGLCGSPSPHGLPANRSEREQLREPAQPLLRSRHSGNEKASCCILSAKATRDLRSPWRTTREYASQEYANNSRWRNSVSTNLSWPRRTCNP